MRNFINAAGDLFLNGIVGSYFSTEIIMLVLCCIITALAAYALGSLNFAVIISKLRYDDDVRKYGSGNAGMTNMLRTYGKGAAAMTFAGDALKTAVAIVIGMILVGSLHGGNYIAGFFAILGHVFPCYYGFKGGKGVVASAVTILMLNPKIFLILIVIFAVIVAIWRYMSLGSVVCAMLYPLLVYADNSIMYSKSGINNPISIIFALIIGLFVVILHRKNIERLMTGKESKISFGKNKRQKYSVRKNKNNKNNKDRNNNNK